MKDRFSRYAAVNSVRVQYQDGIREMLALRETVQEAPLRAFTRVLGPGKDIFLLAQEVFGREDLWYVIADMNPETFYPIETSPDTSFTVPPTDSATVSRFRKT